MFFKYFDCRIFLRCEAAAAAQLIRERRWPTASSARERRCRAPCGDAACGAWYLDERSARDSRRCDAIHISGRPANPRAMFTEAASRQVGVRRLPWASLRHECCSCL